MAHNSETPLLSETPSRTESTEIPGLTSIVIPVYNRERYIRETIESVLAQTISDWELIIVNDGSTDSSEAAICEFTDPRIRYFSQENRGLAQTWNEGLRRARGQFVKLLDSDDLIEPLFLERSLDALRRRPSVDIVHSNWHIIDSDGRRTGEFRIGQTDDYLYSLLLANMFGVHEVLFRRAALDEIGWFDPAIVMCEDWDLYIRLARAGKQFFHLDESLSSHRVHPGTYKKKVVRQFDEVLDKVFSPGFLAEELMRLHPVSRARHALYSLDDYVRWEWPEEVSRASVTEFVRWSGEAAREFGADSSWRRLVFQAWPLAVSLDRYQRWFRPLAESAGAGRDFLAELDAYVARVCRSDYSPAQV